MKFLPYTKLTDFTDIIENDTWLDIVNEVVDENQDDEVIRQAPSDLPVRLNRKVFRAVQLIHQRREMEFYQDEDMLKGKLLHSLKTSIRFALPGYEEKQKELKRQKDALDKLNKVRKRIKKNAAAMVADVDEALKIMHDNHLNGGSKLLKQESIFQLVELHLEAKAQQHLNALLEHYARLNAGLGYGL